MEFISENLKIIILAIVAVFAGIVITIRINRNTNKNKTNQNNNKVGGDQAGRDINKK